MEILHADLGSCSGLTGALAGWSPADLDYCAVADRVDFAMPVRPSGGNLMMEPVA